MRQLLKTFTVAGDFRTEGKQPALNMVDGILHIFPIAQGTGEAKGGSHLVYGAVAFDPKVCLADTTAADQAGITLVSGFGI